ncbi:precorrin-2 C(20)-methyltransferase [Methanococcus voltae]|uniref:Precorrin-2 C20-methyltransferase n=1 Tax=Methanococcus voltae (strain ATCC BAA-1334 / A3) TaxID=456320 RepID=D7DR90_METV3|nr:precorrin-2 C(20)-methyltransferase [Methanococcus voltae]MCS3901027.1 precorrin-2/cobalt-factor-2 C20-methyltransferase [Methanococcus voltae]
MVVNKVYGIGVGPGSKDMITLKAQNVLKNTKKLFVPISKHGKTSVAYEIVKEFLNPETEVIELLFPMCKDEILLKKHWDEATEQIINSEGDVSIITIGDVTLYSTLSYVWHRLKDNKINVEILNGISSPFAAASALNIPLVEGDEKLAILPQGKDLENTLEHFDTVVIMKTNDLEEKLKNCNELMNNKEKYIIGIVNRVSCDNQKMDCGKIDEIDFNLVKEYLSLAIIKKIKE